MRLSAVLLATFAASAFGHSWPECMDWRFNDAKAYKNPNRRRFTDDEGSCAGYPRGFGTDQDWWSDMGMGARGPEILNDFPCGSRDSEGDQGWGVKQGNGYPQPQGKANEIICIIWPAKNHYADTLSEWGKISRNDGTKVYRKDVHMRYNPTAGEAGTNGIFKTNLMEAYPGGGAMNYRDCPVQGAIIPGKPTSDDQVRGQNPPSGGDRMLCGGCVVIPNLAPGEYDFQWIQTLNQGEDYTGCGTLKVLPGACTDINKCAVTAAAPPTQPPVSNPTSGPATGSCPTEQIPFSEVQQHSSQNDCWMVFDNRVFDMTDYLNNPQGGHPGGAGPMLSSCGIDATLSFAIPYHLTQPFDGGEGVCKGVLGNGNTPTPPPFSGNDPTKPTEPGCWHWNPTGCSPTGSAFWETGFKYIEDDWGMANAGSGTDENVCLNDRKAALNNYCNVNDVKMVFNSASTPLPPETYTWSQNHWEACTKPCGGGTSSRTVECIDSRDNVVSDSKCPGTKPVTSVTCNTAACGTAPTPAGSTGQPPVIDFTVDLRAKVPGIVKEFDINLFSQQLSSGLDIPLEGIANIKLDLTKSKEDGLHIYLEFSFKTVAYNGGYTDPLRNADTLQKYLEVGRMDGFESLYGMKILGDDDDEKVSAATKSAAMLLPAIVTMVTLHLVKAHH